jgi:hypothetical protein
VVIETTGDHFVNNKEDINGFSLAMDPKSGDTGYIDRGPGQWLGTLRQEWLHLGACESRSLAAFASYGGD